MSYHDEKSKATLLPTENILVHDESTNANIVRSSNRTSPVKRCIAFVAILALLSAGKLLMRHYGYRRYGHVSWFEAAEDTDAPICPQTTGLSPSQPIAKDLGALYQTPQFKEQAIEWLSSAVQVPTEAFDEMGPVGEDARWEVFGPFHDYLARTFPKVHENLQLKKVNTYGLLYHWQGSDESLKPILLMAHQDVVPVEPLTYDEWIHPPYSGHYDGNYIWGRGSGDDKGGLVGIMASLETLISVGFTPKRTIVLSFGFDEEASGAHGAKQLANEILATYGENSFAMLVDEGGGWAEMDGKIYAVPSVGEKGYFDTRITVSSPGGHSSIPPAHTTIGMLSAILVEYENNPILAHLRRGTLNYDTILCLGEYDYVPEPLKRLIRKSRKSDKALSKLEDILFEDPMLKAISGTTQAIDLINGGVKVNALPETADAVVNHRIALDSSVKEVMERDTALVVPLAKRFNLSLIAYGEKIHTVDGPAYGTIELTDAWGTALEPAPVTPIDPDAEPYKLLSGTIIGTVQTSNGFANRDVERVAVVPAGSVGNTDTMYYWKVTPHIFRYNHNDVGAYYNGAHTVNEAITADSFVEMIKFFTNLVLNADESTTI